MHRFWRIVRALVVLVLALGVAALLAVIFWLPPNDPDSFTLVQERTARLAAYHVKKPMPGAQINAAPLEQRLARITCATTDAQPIYDYDIVQKGWMEVEQAIRRAVEAQRKVA